MALLVLGVTQARAAASPPDPSAAPAPVLSSYEDGSHAVARDDGLSVLLPNGKDLWIFGDTAVYNADQSRTMKMSALIPGGTAAEGPHAAGNVPTTLTETPTPGHRPSPPANQAPALYMPPPSNVYLADGSGRQCTSAPGRYPARWASGAAAIPSTSDVLVTYVDVCVAGSLQFDVEGWGFMEYNWQTSGLDLGPDDVFPPSRSGAGLSPELQLGSPVIDDGRVDLFSFNCTALYVSCLAGQTYFTTVLDSPAVLSSPSSYRVAPASTESFLWRPAGIAVAKYPDAPLRMIEMTGIAGTYDVLTAATPAGPWHLETSGTIPDCQSPRSGFCYALVGHPELSTPSELMISYYDPDAGPSGDSGPIGHLVGVAASYGAAPTGPWSAPPPALGPSSPQPAAPQQPLADGRPAGQAVGPPQCCAAGHGGAGSPEAAGGMEGGPSHGAPARGVHDAHQGDRPPHLGSSVRLYQDTSGSRDRVPTLALGGLAVCLIVAALGRRSAVMAGKSAAALALRIQIMRTGRL
jgi:hypothetical protein